MKAVLRVWLIAACVTACVCGALAQEKPGVAPSATVEKAPPQVPDDAKGLYAQLQVKGAGLDEAMAVLQKERDSINAERARLIQRLIAAQPDYDLAQAGPLAVTYVAKKPEPKKDDTKK